MLNIIFHKISGTFCLSILFVKETGVPKTKNKKQRPAATH